MNAEKCKGNKHIGKYISQLYRKGSSSINKEISKYGIGSGQFMFLLELYKKDGKNRFDLGREEFLRQVQIFAQDNHDSIVQQVKRLGSSLDWSRESSMAAVGCWLHCWC